MNTFFAVVLLATACAVQAGYFGAGPAFFAAPYGYGHHFGPAPLIAHAPVVAKVPAPVFAAPVVAKVAAPLYHPVVAKVPTAVSYSYFHSAHPVPLLKAAAPVFAKVPYGHYYH
uniref:Putative secreted protein n=1 Tax=Ixodes ricinus TaxID=34613 RepID=V5GQA6_IXORI